jgi:hypothetical protein
MVSMIDNIKKFGRSFLVAAAVAGAFLVPSTPVFADDPPTSQQQQRFQINGNDSQRGPFTGQITLTQLPDGQVNVEREVTFQRDGQTLVQAGTGQQRGNEVRARLTQAEEQAPVNGLSGNLAQQGEAAVAPAQQDEARLQLRLNPDRGTLQGQVSSEAGTSREQGQTLPIVSDQQAAPEGPMIHPLAPSVRDQAARDQQAAADAGLPIEAPVVRDQAPAVSSDQAPADQTLPALPSDQTSPALPSDQTSPALPSDQTSPALPSDQTSPALPSDQTSPALPSDQAATLPALPADQTLPVVAADQASPSLPADQAATLPALPADQTLPAPSQTGRAQTGRAQQGRSQTGR